MGRRRAKAKPEASKDGRLGTPCPRPLRPPLAARRAPHRPFAKPRPPLPTHPPQRGCLDAAPATYEWGLPMPRAVRRIK
jgi:hypothetical protein